MTTVVPVPALDAAPGRGSPKEPLGGGAHRQGMLGVLDRGRDREQGGFKNGPGQEK